MIRPRVRPKPDLLNRNARDAAQELIDIELGFFSTCGLPREVANVRLHIVANHKAIVARRERALPRLEGVLYHPTPVVESLAEVAACKTVVSRDVTELPTSRRAV